MKSIVLYHSSEIQACIRRLLGEPAPDDRRVILVAYIGTDGESYLPHPDSLHVICSPTPGATDPDTLRSLHKRGARVEFSDGLHMKVYWSEQRGCLITSANASRSALGAKSLKEAGVQLPPGCVDIDRLIKYADARGINARELRLLDTRTREVEKNRKGHEFRNAKAPEYLDWYSSPFRKQWRLAWVGEEVHGVAKAAKDKLSMEYGASHPYTWINVAKGNVHVDDWVLKFMVTPQGITTIKWMTVDFLVPIDRTDRQFYEKDYPLQAVQVHNLGRCSLPPFKITPAFIAAFREAVGRYSVDRIKNASSCNPPEKLQKYIAEFLGDTARSI